MARRPRLLLIAFALCSPAALIGACGSRSTLPTEVPATDSLAGKQCGPNEAVGDAPFFITTDRLGFTFIGDYFGIAARPGGVVWAAFGDTRNNDVSHGFVARGQF